MINFKTNNKIIANFPRVNKHWIGTVVKELKNYSGAYITFYSIKFRELNTSISINKARLTLVVELF